MSEKTYGSVEFQEKTNSWVITSMLPHARIKFKAIFTKIYSTRQPPYDFKNTLNNANDLHWFMERYPLEISDSDRRKLVRQRNKCIKVNNELHELVLPTNIPEIKGELKGDYKFKPNQARNIALHDAVKRLLVADKVGKGKTLSALGTALNPEHLPIAIIVEPHLQDQWMEKIGEFTYLEAHAIQGTRPYDLPEAHVYVFRYSQLAGWIDVFTEKPFTSVAFDEVQNLRTGTESKRGQAAAVLCEHATAVLGLSATPIYGYGVEIWNIMSFINPDILGDFSSFCREWCPDGKIVKDPDALGEFLRESNCMIRYAGGEDDVQVNSYVEYVPYDSREIKSAEEIAEKLAIRTLSGSFVERGQAARDLDMKMREITGIAKAKSVANYVRMIVESGEKVLLTGWHREVYRIWNEELSDLGISMYTGSESAKQKAQAKEDFISGKNKVMILSLRSGAGLDGLQEYASYIVFGELDWSPEVAAQCIGRLGRDGQVAESVTAIFLLTNYGSDPVIQQLIGIKKSQSSGIVEPGMLKNVSNKDPKRLSKLAQEFLKHRGIEPPKQAA